MAGAWDQGEWGDNAWGTSNNVINATTQVLAVSTGTAEYYFEEGWGRRGWGEYNWDASNLSIDVSSTGQALTLSLASVTVSAELNSGWGRAGWGTDAWGIQGDVLLTGFGLNAGLGTLTVTTLVTQGWGRQTWDQGVWGKPGTVVSSGDFALAATLGTETVTGDAEVTLTGIPLTTSIGDETAKTDVAVSATAQSTLNISTGTLSMAFGVQVTGQALTTYIGKGWGAGAWDAGVWGGVVTASIGASAATTGEALTTAIGTETIEADADVTLTALTPLSFSIGTETIAIGQQVDITGQSIATTLGSATVTTEVNAGWGRQTWGYGVWGAGGIDVALTGQAMALALGDESTQIDVAVTAATQSLTVSLGTAVAGASADVPVTGQFTTTYLGSVNAHLWTEINPDVSMVWTEIAA
jgi:hypothetical protein